MGTILLCIDTFSLDPPSLRHHFVPLGRLNYSTYKFTLKETARELKKYSTGAAASRFDKFIKKSNVPSLL